MSLFVQELDNYLFLIPNSTSSSLLLQLILLVTPQSSSLPGILTWQPSAPLWKIPSRCSGSLWGRWMPESLQDVSRHMCFSQVVSVCTHGMHEYSIRVESCVFWEFCILSCLLLFDLSYFLLHHFNLTAVVTDNITCIIIKELCIMSAVNYLNVAFIWMELAVNGSRCDYFLVIKWLQWKLLTVKSVDHPRGVIGILFLEGHKATEFLKGNNSLLWAPHQHSGRGEEALISGWVTKLS